MARDRVEVVTQLCLHQHLHSLQCPRPPDPVCILPETTDPCAQSHSAGIYNRGGSHGSVNPVPGARPSWQLAYSSHGPPPQVPVHRLLPQFPHIFLTAESGNYLTRGYEC